MGWPNTLSPHDAGLAIEGVWPALFFGTERLPEMQRKVRQLDWARQALARWMVEAEAVIAGPPLLPEGVIGWRHDFYSPATAEHLLFDPRDGSRLVDPWDGAVYRPDGASSMVPEQARGRAWRLLLHERTYRLMHSLAVLYALTGDERYATWVVEGMRRACAMFRRDDLRAANRHGALYFQPLYDAQVLLLLATTYDLTRSSLAYTAADHESVRREIFARAIPDQIAFLDRRAPPNMLAYAAATLAVAGDIFGRADWRAPAYEHPRSGFSALLGRGLRRDARGRFDGFWVEGTQFYHLYSLCPLIALLERADAPAGDALSIRRSVRAEQRRQASQDQKGERASGYVERVCALLDAPARMADEALRLPALGDLGAPKHLSLRLYRHLYEYAAGRLDEARFGPLLARLYSDGAARDSLAAVAYGPDQLAAPPRGRRPHPWRSEGFPAMGLAFLRATSRRSHCPSVAAGPEEYYQVWLRAGAHGEGHDHLDKLSFGLHAAGEVLVTDLGTAGYGNAAFTAYCRSTFAHSTILVDERSQERVSRARLRMGKDWAAGVLEDAYPGVRLARHIRLAPPYVWLDDRYESAEVHRFGWVLHVYGSLVVTAVPASSTDAAASTTGKAGCAAQWPVPASSTDAAASTAADEEPLPALPEDGPFAWLANRDGGTTRVPLCADWRIRDGLWLRLWAVSDGLMEWTAGQTPGNPIPDRRRTLLLRVRGSQRLVRAVLEVHHGAPTLAEAPAELLADAPLMS